MSRRLSGLTAIHVLLLVAILEVAINRIAVPMLRPEYGAPPEWHRALDYAGLFLFYFTGVLTALVLLARVLAAWDDGREGRVVTAYAIAAIAGVLAAIPLVTALPPTASLALEAAFAVAVIALAIAGLGRDRDLGAQIGLFVLAVPLALHAVDALGTALVWGEDDFDGPGVLVARAGVVAIVLAALATPYVFGPRPFARALTRPVPVLATVVVAAAGAFVARWWYPQLAHASTLATGVRLQLPRAGQEFAIYLLAISTLTWTLAATALAQTHARRAIGAGIALVVLGGYGFHWPHHYLLPLLGLVLIVDALLTVREEELQALPAANETPRIADTVWSQYVGALANGLRRTLTDVHTLTTRGEGGLASSVIVGDANGLPVRARIERIDGCVLAIDVVLGREIDEVRGATLTLWAIPPRQLGINPPGPPAAPPFRSGDAPFDERFRARGNAALFQTLFDDGLRARATATLDGWLAYWEREGLRYRVYPGRGAPLDHPLPLSDLAFGKPATAERILAVIDLLVEIAQRGTVARAVATDLDEPAVLA